MYKGYRSGRTKYDAHVDRYHPCEGYSQTPIITLEIASGWWKEWLGRVMRLSRKVDKFEVRWEVN